MTTDAIALLAQQSQAASANLVANMSETSLATALDRASREEAKNKPLRAKA